MTAPTHRTASTTALQTSQVRTHFPTPTYGRHALTLPPGEAVPGEPKVWEAVQPVRPDTLHVRVLRFLNATGDLLAVLMLIGGGVSLIGLATHL